MLTLSQNNYEKAETFNTMNRFKKKNSVSNLREAKCNAGTTTAKEKHFAKNNIDWGNKAITNHNSRKIKLLLNHLIH